ncbi:MAG: magnesium transporter [Bacilli bacterium]|jgi:magnesium transporter|nr:magnesium transporter [Erysipelotrichia bacterium]
MELEKINTQEFEALIKERNVEKLRDTFETIPTIDLAEVANDFEDIKDLIFVFKVVKSEYTAEFFTDLSSDIQEKLIELFSDEDLVTLLNASFSDDIVDFMEDMPANLVSKILKSVNPTQRTNLNQLLNYKEDTAGSIMTTEFIELTMNLTVKEALIKIRETGRKAETIYTIFVRDNKRRFIGTIDLEEFIYANENELLEDLADKSAFTIGVNTDQEEVATLFKRYNLNAIAVLNEDERLIGIITIDDIVDVIEQEATEDISKMALVTPLEDSYKQTSIGRMALKTMPWLIVLMVLGAFSSMILSSFQDALASLAILSVFIPVLMDTGGNSGGQTVSLMIRGLAVGEFTPKDFWKILWKEFRVALLVSLIVSGFAFGWFILEMYVGIVHFAPEGLAGGALLIARLKVSAIVSLTLFATIVFSKTLAVAIPMFVKVLKKDPALISEPFITTIVDVLALLIYFFIASSLFQLV